MYKQVAAHGWKAQAFLFSSLCITYTWQRESTCFFAQYMWQRSSRAWHVLIQLREFRWLSTKNPTKFITNNLNPKSQFQICCLFTFFRLKTGLCTFRKVPLIIFVSRSEWSYPIALKPSIFMPMAILWGIEAWYHFRL